MSRYINAILNSINPYKIQKITITFHYLHFTSLSNLTLVEGLSRTPTVSQKPDDAGGTEGMRLTTGIETNMGR